MKDTRKKEKITKRTIDSIAGIKGFRFIVSDTEVPGFRIVVGEQSKTFILEKRVVGVTTSPKKFKIGQYPIMTVGDARETAKRWAILCADGQDPTQVMTKNSQEKGGDYDLKKRDLKTVTLKKALEIHIDFVKPCQETIAQYRSSVKTRLNEWTDTPLDDIKMADVVAKGHQIAAEVSKSRAKRVLSNLRAIWNTAKTYCDCHGYFCPGNPLKLIHLDRMFEYDERKIVIPFNQVGRFIDLLEQLKNDPKLARGKRWTIRVYLVSLFLGMRNEEARMMKWEYVDLDAGYFKLPGKIVKNNKDHHKAISRYALSILKEMYEERIDPNNPYVFQTPSPKNHLKGQFISPMRMVQKMVIDGMGGAFEYEPHALRRTFISLADAINTPRKVLKNLVNHISGDVTDGYCVKGFNPKQEAPHLNRIEQAF
ncbi:MAG: tyrosine-type recombinase/integrase, partial [Gammaproteobacteria bacterium]|nr:tyrosine-type recombinase/integrase [Gammaproteobacteria bacterium]